MSNQIVISSGAKVRELEGVLTGTSGIVSSVPLGAANGVATLDSGGKVPVSQLPSSVVTYLGTWNAATNTPTLVNGTGDAGDMYICNVAGTVNFGAGPVTFAVGDWVLYGSGTWQKSSGQNGTVTSVAASITGNAVGLTGSPFTTAGTLAFAFAGTNLQYVNGAGNLTTFPTLITSIGLSMPSAFSVANSPLTANGTIAVTGAGYASQYIRGDGTLADFPSSGGGGSSVSYYLNGGTSQGTIGGVTYYEMSKTADTGTGVDFTKSGDGFIVAFLTDANDPAQLNIPAGNWNYEIYASMSANGGTPQMYAELYKYDGTTFTLISTSSNEILYDGTNLNLYTFGMTVPATTLALTDRLAIKLYATNSGGKTTTVHTQDSHLCQVITTFSTGITALNGLTAQVQYFQVGTSGTDFNISSTTATHTFNIPDASATARGLITTGTQTIAGIKTFSSGINVDYIGVTGDISMDGSFSLKQVAYGTLQSGYTNLSGQTNGIRVGLFGGYNALLNFSTSGSYTYTFPNATGTIALTSDIPSLAGYVTLGTTQTITGAKTFSAYTTFTSTVDITSGLTFSNSGFTLVLQPPTLSVNRTVTLPNGTGTLALTSDISYPVTSVFGRTGAVVATSGDYTTAQVTEVTNLYYTDTRARLALSFVAGSGAYNNTTGVITIPTNNNQITNGAGYITGNQTITLSGDVSGSGTTAITTTIGALKVTNAMLAGSIDLTTKVTGLLPDGNISSAATWNAKQNAITLTTTGTSGAATLVGSTLNIPQYTDAYTGTVTSVAALTIGTSGTDLSSSVANSTTTPVITLNVPTASATNRGALSSADWTTFNNKQSALTNPVTGTGTTNYLPKFTGTSTIGNSVIQEASNNIGIGFSPSYKFDVNNVGGASATARLYGNDQANVRLRLENTGGRTWELTGGLTGANNSAFTIYDVTAAATRLQIDASGNLGLGVTPTGKLHIGLPAYSNEDTDSQQAIFGVASGYGVRIGYNETGNYGVINVLKPAVAWGYLILQSGGGNVLIGTTTNSTYKLDVNGTGRFTSNLLAQKVQVGTAASINDAIGVGNTLQFANYSAGVFVTASADSYIYKTSSVFGGLSAQTLIFQTRSDVAGGGFAFVAGTTPSAIATISNTGAATFSSSVSATSFFEVSDKTQKTLIQDNVNIKGIENILAKTYIKNDKQEIGYFAQDLKGVLDSSINIGENGLLSLSYTQVHTAKISSLESRVKYLEEKLMKYEL